MFSLTESQAGQGITAAILYFFLQGLFSFLGSCVLLFLMFVGIFTLQDGRRAVGLSVLLFLALVVVMMIGIGSLLVGYGLRHRHPWSRWGAIMLSVLLLPGIPVFTLIGLVMLWYFFQPQVVAQFEAAGDSTTVVGRTQPGPPEGTPPGQVQGGEGDEQAG
ncbi:MAG: hypothetical protein D6775_02560 [Caldilineae bacterium]|nr:MAG: hypothetical protein D6775_02560 [Caldilineae bacterium]